MLKLPQHRLNLPDGEIYWQPQIFSEAEGNELFSRLEKKIEWRQDKIRIFGKWVDQPRLTAWYGDPGMAYTYSGLTMVPNEWTDSLLAIKQKVENYAEVTFNSVLLNLYRDGKDSMGWHSDNEPELGENPIIASVSLGGARRFHLKHKYKKAVPRIRLDLSHGSLLLMQGATQHHWQHQISKTTREVQPRINLTFRRLVV